MKSIISEKDYDEFTKQIKILEFIYSLRKEYLEVITDLLM